MALRDRDHCAGTKSGIDHSCCRASDIAARGYSPSPSFPTLSGPAECPREQRILQRRTTLRCRRSPFGRALFISTELLVFLSQRPKYIWISRDCLTTSLITSLALWLSPKGKRSSARFGQITNQKPRTYSPSLSKRSASGLIFESCISEAMKQSP